MLLTKLHIPASGQNIVHRTALFEKLDSGLGRKLILISAPAGYGKTTLLGDWISLNKIPAAWLSLDIGDNDPVVFLSYVVAGIQTIHPGLGQNAIGLLNTPNSPAAESIAGLLINDLLGINKDFLLVLDDFHLIRSAEVLKLVSYFLEHIPGNTHIVVLTRSDPALSLSRLRSQNQVIEMRSSDLSFSANDISLLFNKKLKFGLSPEDVCSLESKTEGWIAGLQLVAISMQGRENLSEFVSDLKGDNRYIMDYLMEEVLRIQTDEIKDFLIKTSVLEQMSAPLCNAILNRNDSQPVIEWLERNNMFIIPLDEERTWYRYHHLFAELLKQRLRLADKAIITDLHDKTCEWFRNNSMPLLAIDHAILSENLKKGVDLLGEIVETLWKNGQHATIMKYGGLLPDELIKKNSNLSLYYAWILIIDGKNQKAEPILCSAEILAKEIINNKNSSKETVLLNKQFLGKVYVAFGCLYSKTSFPEKTFNYCKAAMKNLSEKDSFWLSWAWYSIGWAEEVSGHVNECTEAVEKALYYGKKSGSIYLISTNAFCVSYMEQRRGLYTSAYNKCSEVIKELNVSDSSQITRMEPNIGQLYMCMAEIDCMRADFDAATEHIRIAYNLSRNFSNSSSKVWVRLIYALILYGRGENEEINKLLNETEELLKINTISPSARALFVDMKGKMFVDRQEYNQAETFFKENGLNIHKEVTYVEDRGFFSFVLLLIAKGKCKEAENILSDLHLIMQAANWTETLVTVKILCAVLHKNSGNSEKAVAILLEALELASDEKILMPFIYNHDWIKDLTAEVYKLQAAAKTRIPKEVTDKLKLAVEKRNKEIQKTNDYGLSGRELEVLKQISQELTNRQIAENLFVSVDTIKTHVKNILLKLEIDSRIRAVKKAKELGII